MNEILAPISTGELLDKISILTIKSDRISDPAKLKNITAELAILNNTRANWPDIKLVPPELENDLGEVNRTLWDIENDIRACEKRQDFGEEFIALARAVYTTNDKRSELKKQINLACGSTLVEEKSYDHL